jgi:hypothetical protein
MTSKKGSEGKFVQNFKHMKNRFTRFATGLMLSLCMMGSSNLMAQLSAPKVENVWGARVLSITGYAKTSDTTRLYISTESANSIFYSDIYNPAGASFNFSSWKKVNSADANDNLGGNMQQLGVHKTSGTVYCIDNKGLYAIHPDSSKHTRIDSNNINALCVKDSVLIYVTGNQLFWGRLEANGKFVKNFAAPKMLSLFVSQIVVHPVTHVVYFFQKFGTGPQISKTNHPFYDLKNTTTFTSVPMGVIPGGTQFSGLGISPSGRIFMGGHKSPGAPEKTFRYTDDEITWNNVNFPNTTNGVSGTNFGFAGSASSYYTYHSDGYSSNKGLNWVEFGSTGKTTNPNDGEVFCDPNDTNVVYFTSDLGIAVSLNRGSSSTDLSEGLEAVQVQDFDMTADKQTAWIASKAGIRKVSRYKTASPVWTTALWPNGDGSPYFSIAMKPSDTNTVYAGNLRVYKTTNGGSSWNQSLNVEVGPYFYPSVGTTVTALEVAFFNENIVFAGFSIQDSSKGGLFFSSNAGSSWSQILLEASSIGKDVDVTDIAFNIEGSDTVAYVTVAYDLSKPQGRSVYRVLKSGSTWTGSQNMNSANTSTGTVIVASLEDVLVSATRDTLYVTGTDAGINHPITYYKIISGTNKWTPMTTSGYPFVSGKKGKAVALGGDTVFCAVDADIYMYVWGTTSWTLGYSYPVGTQINFLYYDELLAGTSTGLYGHVTQTNASACYINKYVKGVICGNNPFVFNGKSYFNGGVYKDTLVVSNACDTIYTLELIKPSSAPVSINRNACFGSLVQLPNGSFITAENSRLDSIKLNSSLGCDSLILFNLTVTKINISVTKTGHVLEANQSGAIYQWLNCKDGKAKITGANQKTFQPTVSGEYAVQIKLNDCIDTSECFEVNIACYIQKEKNGIICGNGRFIFNGKVYEMPGTFKDTINVEVGCDTVYTIHISRKEIIPLVLNFEACFGEEILLPNGQKWMAENSMRDTFKLSSPSGCDSIIIVNVEVHQINTNVSVGATSLESLMAGASYQWLDCRAGKSPISGATSKSYSPTVNGEYAVEIKFKNCVDTSICYAFNPVGLGEFNLNQFLVYPNPTQGIIKIETNAKGRVKTILLDIHGKNLFENQFEGIIEIDLSTYPAGMYQLLFIDSAGASLVKKVHKY